MVGVVPMRCRIFTDGGARGNPGPAGIGFVITSDVGETLAAFGDYIGETTNNQAEYRAMIAALERAKALGVTDVSAFADSELLVKQLNREYRVRNKDLAPLFLRVWNLAQSFARCSFSHVRREGNRDADRLVNAAIDARGKVDAV